MPKGVYERKLLDPRIRFWSQVETGDVTECWLWRASLSSGYGAFWDGEVVVRAHVYSWELVNGPVPDGLCVLHTCDVRKCVNPTHLYAGTYQDNSDDAYARNRMPVGEDVGNSKLTAAAVREIRQRSKHETQAKLARIYGVAPATISEVVNHKTWKHVK